MKLTKFNGSKQFIQRRWMMEAYIPRNNIDLLGHSNPPEVVNTKIHRMWPESSIMTKRLEIDLWKKPAQSLIFTSKTENYLWNSPDRIYTNDNAQADNVIWEKNLNRLKEVLENISALKIVILTTIPKFLVLVGANPDFIHEKEKMQKKTVAGNWTRAAYLNTKREQTEPFILQRRSLQSVSI